MAKSKFKSVAELPASHRKTLEKHFTNVDGDTFVMMGLPPELSGGVLARYSRARTGLRLTLVNEFLDDEGQPSEVKGTKLMDKVLNDFSDESVGELVSVQVGMENVSILLTKTMEDVRIGMSPIEKSTRYVPYDEKDEDGNWRYLRPKEIMESEFAVEYVETNDQLFGVYSRLVPKLIEHFKGVFTEDQFTINFEKDGEVVKLRKDELTTDEQKRDFRIGYRFTVRCAALDVSRRLLPASALTNVGFNINGRGVVNLLTVMKSSDLNEDQERAVGLETELDKVIPTFIKKNRRIEEWSEINSKMDLIAKDLFTGIVADTEPVTLVRDTDYFTEVIAYSLYPHTNISLEQIMDVVEPLSLTEKENIFGISIGKRDSRRDRTDRGIEAGYPIVYNTVMTYGAWRDVHRHRMTTQRRQPLTSDLGFVMDPEIGEVGMEEEVRQVVEKMHDLNVKLRKAGFGLSAQYTGLLGDRIRAVFGMNLRSAQQMLELRTQPMGHYGYRVICMTEADKLYERDPWTEMALQFVNREDPGGKISRAKEQGWIVGKNLQKGVDSGIDL